MIISEDLQVGQGIRTIGGEEVVARQVLLNQESALTPEERAVRAAEIGKPLRVRGNRSPRFECHATLFESSEQFTRELSVSGQVSAGVIPGAPKLSFAFSSLKTDSRHQVYYLVHARRIFTVSALQNFQLLDEKKALLDEVVAREREGGDADMVCTVLDHLGDGVASAVTYGQEVLIVVQFFLRTKEEQAEVTANLQGAVGNILELDIKAKSRLQRTLRTFRYSMSNFTRGMSSDLTLSSSGGLPRTEQDFVQMTRALFDSAKNDQGNPIDFAVLNFAGAFGVAHRDLASRLDRRVLKSRLVIQTIKSFKDMIAICLTVVDPTKIAVNRIPFDEENSERKLINGFLQLTVLNTQLDVLMASFMQQPYSDTKINECSDGLSEVFGCLGEACTVISAGLRACQGSVVLPVRKIDKAEIHQGSHKGDRHVFSLQSTNATNFFKVEISPSDVVIRIKKRSKVESSGASGSASTHIETLEKHLKDGGALDCNSTDHQGLYIKPEAKGFLGRKRPKPDWVLFSAVIDLSNFTMPGIPAIPADLPHAPPLARR